MIYKTNIVLMTDCLADLAGGAEKQIYGLAAGLDKDKYNVFVISLDCWGKAPRALIESTGSQLHIFRVVRVYGISGLVQGVRLFNFLRRNRITVIVSYHFSSDMWGTFWGKLAGVPAIMSNRRDMGFWRNAWHIKAYRLINPWVNKIIVNAQSIKQMVIETEGVKSQHIEVIYNGITIAQEENNFIPSPSNDIVIIHVANLKPVKGHKYLIEAFAGIVKQFPRAKLVLIGNDELNGQIQEMASCLNLQSNVLFMGKRDNVPQLLALADICVLPSLSEGMSNSILEYMAASKPVVATRVGGNPELVRHEINGLLVDKENVQQLKEALLMLIQNKEKRRIMGENGLLRVRTEFSMEAMVAHYDQLLRAPVPHKKIRVLHLVSSGGLYGAERVILNLAARRQEAGTYIGVFHNLHNPHLEMIDEAKRRGLENIVFESRGQLDFHTVHAVKEFLLANDIDVLHTHNYKSDIVGFWASRWANRKWIATNHGWLNADRKSRFYEMIDAHVLKYAQKVICVSHQIMDDLIQKGLKAPRLQVIDNGIPIEEFDRVFSHQSRLALGIKPFECAVVIVGRLSQEKGHEVFLKAAAIVTSKVKNMKFLIVGDGPLEGFLKQKSQDLSLSDHVVFTGPRDDMPSIYGSCDIIVNASYREGLPMTILEAMASHLPIIATRVGGIPLVIENQKNGVLIEPGDPQALALSIIELEKDKQKRQQFAQKAYEDVCDRFSDARMADQYNQVYAQCF